MHGIGGREGGTCQDPHVPRSACSTMDCLRASFAEGATWNHTCMDCMVMCAGRFAEPKFVELNPFLAWCFSMSVADFGLEVHSREGVQAI